MNSLAGKVALVVGAATGIGAAVVRRFASEGAVVVASGIPLPTLDDDLRRHGVTALTCDVTQDDQVRAVVAATLERHGRIDVLVNAAGVIAQDDAAWIEDGIWSRQHETNLAGTMRTMRAVLPHMLSHGGGAVVNIASIQGQIFTATFIPYTVSKAGVRGLTGALAVALAPHNIRVNAVAPGWTATSMNKVADDPNATEKRLQMIPLRRIGQPENIADTVFFLASQQAAYMTGQTVTVDGGRTLGAPPA